MKYKEIKRKIGNSLTENQRLLAFFGLLAISTGAAITWAAGKGAVEEVSELEKPEANRESVQERLFVGTDQEEAQSYIVEVPARQYTSAEVERLLEEGRNELDRQLLGENDSSDLVTEKLWLATETADGRVAVEWSIDHPEYLRYDGTPAEDIPAEGVLVRLEARLTCQAEERYYHKQVVLYPETEGERAWIRQVEQALEEANEDSTEEMYHLPQFIGGKAVIWNRSRENPALVLSLTILATGVLLVWRRREQSRQEEQKHRAQLLRDYPAFVSRICLFMGAGLSVRQVFYRMADSGEKYEGKGRNKPRDYLAEELRLTCKELEQGVSGTQAYRHLGERSGLLEYRRFTAQLVQNIRKGNQELLAMLQREADKAFADRRRNAEILGSKAGTKLLMPMGLMLVVVLILVVFPACVSFYG